MAVGFYQVGSMIFVRDATRALLSASKVFTAQSALQGGQVTHKAFNFKLII